MFFGRPGGPARAVLATVAVVVLALLTFVIVNLNDRLDKQEQTDQRTLAATSAIVNVNDKLTQRLAQLNDLTRSAQATVAATKGLGPLLIELRTAIKGAADLVTSDTSSVQTTNAQLTTIQGVLNAIRDKVVPLVPSVTALGGQAKQLLAVVRGLVSDLRSAVAAAEKINRSLPLPG
ncbi:MAG TPA: hypothetical protein VLJ59_01235 [Mycobacteriales bacterium]|nr:hypothetical protein [Mycobacteriales bacterium]